MRSPGLVSVHGPRSSVFESFSTTCKCIIGSGILSLPYAFMEAGWLVGSLGLALMALMGYLTMSRIIACVHLTRARLRRHKLKGGRSDRFGYGSLASQLEAGGGLQPPHPEPSPSAEVALQEAGLEGDPDFDTVGYQQVAGVCYGARGRIFVDTVLVFAQMGCGTAFLSLVLTSVQAVLLSYDLDVHLAWVACAVFPVVLLLALPRTTTYLAPAAHIGNLTLLVCVGTLVYAGLTAPTSQFAWTTSTWSTLPAYSGQWQGVLVFCGICAFSFAAHAEIVAVEADAVSARVYSYILPVAIATIGALYIAVGAFTYACFREGTRPNVLLNLGDALYVNVVRIAMAATLVVNYALAVLPAAQALDLVLLGRAPVSLLPHQVEPTDQQRARSSSNSLAEQAAEAPAAAAVVDERRPLIAAPRPQQPNGRGNPFVLRPVGGAAAGSGVPNGVSAHWPLESPPSEASPSSSGAVAAAARPLSSASSSSVSSLSRSGSDSAMHLAAQEERQKSIHWFASKGNVLRVLMCIATFTIAVLVHNLGVLLSVVGSVAGGILCFTLPPVLWLKLCELEGKPLSRWQRAALLFQALCGLALISAGLIVVIESAHNSFEHATVPVAQTASAGDASTATGAQL